LNGAEIVYTDFAHWLTQLQHFAGLLSRVNITVGPTPAAPATDPDA
jgi:hypothetical protein